MRVSTLTEDEAKPAEDSRPVAVLETGRKERGERDLEIINANAERLNKEAADTLEYQADLVRRVADSLELFNNRFRLTT